jgi:L-threonylcarbamoyladenylate synthase
MEDPQETIRKGAEILRNGGIVIFPTDTAFGIGCRIDSKAAVDRLFELRKRPRHQATPVLVESRNMAEDYFDGTSERIEGFMRRYWPGALTIVSWCRTERIYEPVRGGSKTVGLRMPDHPIPVGLIRSIGVPILGPSANFHNGKTPYETKDVDTGLIALADLFIPGMCRTGLVSTVVDCTEEPYKIIRQGAVKITE